MKAKPLTLDDDQMRCLSSLPRLDLYNALRVLGSASIAELVEFTGKQPKSLYYHLQALQKVGLVVTGEPRKVAKTVEAIYEPVGDPLEMDLSKSPQERSDYISGVLRLAEREVRKAVDLPLTDPQRGQSTHVFRTTVRLSERDLKTLERMLSDAVDFAKQASKRDSGTRVAATLIVIPVRT